MSSWSRWGLWTQTKLPWSSLGEMDSSVKWGVYIRPTKTRTRTFAMALFLIAPNWQQLKCPSVDEWTNDRWYLHAMEFYSAIKRNEEQIHNMDKPQKHVEWKKPDAKEYTLCNLGELGQTNLWWDHLELWWPLLQVGRGTVVNGKLHRERFLGNDGAHVGVEIWKFIKRYTEEVRLLDV